jgi:TDG/mug DNA glycosylase family protein
MAAGRFTRSELEAVRGATVADHLPPRLRLLFVGINPSLWTAAAGAHFARPGNRFWPALHAAGIVDHVIDASAGLTPGDEATLAAAGVGISNLVATATARADELSAAELTAGSARLVHLVERTRPPVVAVLGVTAYRTAFRAKQVVLGRQPNELAGAELWVLPNPSGLNAHETVASLGEWYRAAARAAGVPLTQ